jgi:hypothetical protein
MKRFIALGLSALTMASPVLAEDLKAILDKVMTFEKEGNYQKALDELAWAKKELEKKNSEQLVKLFPDELVGLKGEKAEVNSALGITNLERNYASDSTEVKVSITGTGGAAGGLGGLAAFGQMAAMMGAQSGQDVFRIDGMTASMEGEGSNSKLSVFLSGGSILMFELNRGSDSAILKKMAETIGVTKIDNKLKGVS